MKFFIIKAVLITSFLLQLPVANAAFFDLFSSKKSTDNSNAANPVNTNQTTKQKVTGSYAASTQQLEALEHDLKKLSKSFKLYKFDKPLALFDQIISQLNAQAERDIYARMRNNFIRTQNEIKQIATELKNAANNSEPKKFRHNLSKLKKIMHHLEEYASRSNEININVAQGMPPTYKKILNRMHGVYNALHDVAKRGALYKANEDIKQLNAVATNIATLFEGNIIAAVKKEIDTSIAILHDFSQKLHKAKDNEDRNAAIQAFTKKVGNALHELEEFGNNDSIESKLKRADALFKKRKLTSPPGNNAYALYRQVLNADPSNKRAEKGIHKIVNWYFHEIEELAEHGKWNKVSIYSKKILKMLPGNKRAQFYHKKAQANHHH